MSTDRNIRTVCREQIVDIWQSFNPEQQAWAMLKMSDSLRETLHSITGAVEPKRSIEVMLDVLKTPNATTASSYRGIMDVIRGGPELRLVEFLKSLQEQWQ